MAVKSIVKVSELEGTKRLDAEYYQPKYFEALNILQHLAAVPLASVVKLAKRRFKPVADQPFQYIEISEVNTSTGDVNSVSLLGNEAPDRAQWIVRKGDVIISTVRPIRNAVAIVTDREDGFVCSSGFAVVKAKEIAPEFLFIFLKARPIIELLDRKTTATMYPAVSWQDVLSLPIFKPDRTLEELTIERVREAQQSLQQSKSLYLQAEQMLLDELKWDKLDFSQPKSYAISLSQAKDLNRVDAEHFQPKYDCLLQHLSRIGETKRLGDILKEPIQKGITPDYLPEGEIVVVNSQHLGRYCLNFEATDRTTEEFWRQNRRAQIQNLDLMMYATGAPYVGRSNIYFERGRKAIAGVDILLVRLNPRICHPVYLSVFCNSAIGMEQAAKYQKGSNQQHLYPDDVKQFLVYLPPMDFQEKIADLVLQSYQARKKAKALLEEAKGKVEELIEKKGS